MCEINFIIMFKQEQIIKLIFSLNQTIQYNHITCERQKQMKIIIHEGVNRFRQKKCEGTSQDSNILRYIKQHQAYQQSFNKQLIMKQIKQKVSIFRQQNDEIRNRLEQLSLYLNNQKNKSMFQIYQIILKNPRGVTYKDIDNKVKIGIVSVSHYCCRLKKMNFVELVHQKNEKVVYPKDANAQKKGDQQDQNNTSKSRNNPFHFSQLSMVDNIWVNVSSYQSYKLNGITNEDIKEKLCKTSQTKLIMKLVDQVGGLYDFERQMVSQGKVFQNRFRNFTNQIINVSMVQSKVKQNQIQQKLSPRIQSWLRNKFPQFGNERFLFNFINSQLKDYLSACGLRSAKRNCTPIKLIRYIKILNSLNNHYPQTHIQLKNFIIEEQRQIANGTMHKRSILGILNGLVSKGVLKRQQPYYYPLWQPEGQIVSINRQDEQNKQQIADISKPKKKVKLSSLTTDKQIQKKVGVKQYKKQLKTRLIFAILEQFQLQVLKKSLKNIKRARLFQDKKGKNQIKMYEPQLHIFKLLEGDNYKNLPKLNAKNCQQLKQKIDEYVETQGSRQQAINVNYQIIKILRKCPIVKQIDLKNRFGNSWQEKISPLIKQNLVQQQSGLCILKDQTRYLV